MPKTVVITGTATGMGRATVTKFAGPSALWETLVERPGSTPVDREV
jgi:NAD(P)-dependent dehydrogenase (short-subunit alcohol dehydrogenase family)